MTAGGAAGPADDGGGRGPEGRLVPSEISYAEATRELDEIVAFFEERDVDVDLLVAKLERATALVEELDRRIRTTAAQVGELVPRLTSAVRHPDEGEGGSPQ